jgi:hypothetical protein
MTMITTFNIKIYSSNLLLLLLTHELLHRFRTFIFICHSAISVTGIRRRESAFASPSPSATAADSVVVMNAANSAVSRISVCTGELCQCQGEQYEYTGGAAFAVMEGLKNIGLPFPIDEVGCMVSFNECYYV